MNSMTGFGRGSAECESLRINLEIKSLNHRYTDFNIRMPHQLNPFEDLIKSTVKRICQRGRFDLYIQLEFIDGSDSVIVPNYAVIDQYVNVLKALSARYDLINNLSANQLIGYKDALTIQTAELDEAQLKQTLVDALNVALERLQVMRRTEGDKLAVDIDNQLAVMVTQVEQLGARAPEISEHYYRTLKRRMQELLQLHEVDESRLLAEAAVFADKTNISEELVRLTAHIDQLKAIMDESEPKGRRMDFLIQEMNREVNTIGSKSPDIDISNYVIVLKSQLEKIREQVQNIE